MDAAAVRIVGSVIKWAAPRYAANADVLDGPGYRRHGGDTRQRACEVELATRHSAGTKGRERVLQQILSFREFKSVQGLKTYLNGREVRALI